MAVNKPARPIIGQPNGTGGIVNEWDLKYYDDVWGSPEQNNGTELTGISIYGTPSERGAENAGRNNAGVYYGSSKQIGEDAQDYRNRVKSNLNTPSGLANRMTTSANQDISRANAKAGMAGVNTSGASIREKRNSIAKANEVQQATDQVNLSNYGKSISAGIAGTEGLAAAAKGQGLASTPTPTPSYGGMFGSIICTELYSQKRITLKELSRCTAFGLTIHDNTYSGYLTIAKPVVALMKKSGLFSSLFVGWARAISIGEPNLFTRIMIPVCYVIGSLKSEVKDARRA